MQAAKLTLFEETISVIRVLHIARAETEIDALKRLAVGRRLRQINVILNRIFDEIVYVTSNHDY